MRRTYAGVEIELPYVVWFTHSAEAATPIFHAMRIDGSGRTRCGVELWDVRLNDLYGRVRLVARHAVKFGRPCTQCWPQLRKQRSLWSKPKPEPKVEQEALA